MNPNDITRYLHRLNGHCARTLAAAVALCETRAHRHVEVEHWLIKMLEQGDGDLLAILRRYQLDIDAIWQGLLAAVERLPHDLRGKPSLSPRLVAWLEAAWLRASLDLREGGATIRSAHLLAALVEHPRWLRAADAWALLTLSSVQIERLMPELDAVSAEAAASGASDREPPRELDAPADETLGAMGAENIPPTQGSLRKPRQDALDRFTTDVTQRAREGLIDPVFGRDTEVRQMVDILLRRRKNNPILVGEPGVGKTALVEGLALKIVEGDVPAAIRDVRLIALDLGLLQAGAGVKGEFEQRLKNVIQEVQQSSVPILLFIDEAHTLIGAGNTAGGADAANLLKPALARGELRTIAATTWSEYKQYFERDAALERRFQMVKVEEPGDDQACLMLRGLKDRYAAHHRVHITDAGLRAAVRLSRRYLTGRQLPDKAIDVLDTAAARVRMSMDTMPIPMVACESEQAALEAEREALAQDEAAVGANVSARLADIDLRLAQLEANKVQLAEQHASQQTAVSQLEALRQQWHQARDASTRQAIASSLQHLCALRSKPEDMLVHAEVDESVVASVIADWTGVPAGDLLDDELAVLLELEAKLGDVIIGQDEALAALGKSLRAAKAGLTNEHAPLGVFLLVGPSGVGKTETARSLAALMFGGERSIITINLSEYQEAHTVSQLKGAPPGYVGYGQGGVLTEAVRQRPYSVILLDEVEKAHRDVLNLFYQVFDRGFMRDGEGRIVDFRNTVILMTSNLGSADIVAMADAAKEAGSEITGGMLVDAIRPLLAAHFQPALLARFQTIVYRPLSGDALMMIARMKLQEVAERVRRRFHAELTYGEDVLRTLVEACQVVDSGARHIDHLLDQQVLPVLSRELLARAAQGRLGERIRLSYSEEEGLVFDFEQVTDCVP